MAEQHKPGEKVQTSGIYKVVKDGDGASFEVTCVCGASVFFGHRFGVKRVIQTGVVDVEESQYQCGCARGAGRSA